MVKRHAKPLAGLAAPAAGGVVLSVVLVAGGLLYATTGGAARDNLISQMMINAIVVVGIQVFVGNTGVLSFGHVGFGGIAGFTFALFAIDPTRKATIIPNAPFGLDGAHVPPVVAVLVAMGVALAVAVVVGYALVRSGAQSGAVSATVITLALLFLVHEVAVNWTDLTGGDRAGLSFPIGGALDSNVPIVIALVLAVVVARLFAAAPVGRLAKAAREDDLAARAMGINPAVQQVAALLLSVAIVALGSALRVWELGTVTPRFFFFDYTLLTLTMLIVGGRNSLTGALVGVVLITTGQELTRYLAGPSVTIDALDWILRDGLTSLFLGGSMLGFMILRPDGLLRDWELDEWFTRRRRARREQSPPRAAPTVTAGAPVELAVDGVGVVFGAFRALDDATLHATSDTVVGVIGPNGAGKTTLLNVVTGLVPVSEGSVVLDGVDLTGLAPHAIARAGLVRTFQNLRLFGALTVRENIAVAAIVAARHRADRTRPDVDELLVLCGLWELRDRRAGELDYGNSRRLELARAAAAAPTFLLLDEPTSGMSDTESVAMIEHVRSTAAAAAAGVVVIDHDLAFITGICDRIVCFDQGTPIAAGTAAEIQADPLVQAAYLGTAAVR